MSLRICVAGVTGWTGRPVAVVAAQDLALASGVSRAATWARSGVRTANGGSNQA